MAPEVAADTNAPAPRRAALCIGVADPAADGPDRGAEDATHLGAAFRKAGFAPVIELTGDRARRDAILAALFRIRAGTRTGDLVVVTYTGPVRVERDGETDRFLLPPAGAAEDEALPVGGVIAPLAAQAEADVAILITGLPRLGTRSGGTGPWRASGTPAGPPRSYSFLASGGRGEATEFSGPHTLLGANLASEFERALDRHPGGASLRDWLRAATRRVVLESGARQTPELTVAGDANAARIQAVSAVPPPQEPAANLSSIAALHAEGRTDAALSAGLRRAADLVESGSPGPAPDLDGCLELLDRIALASGRVDLSMVFTSERVRRATDPAARVHLLHALGRLFVRTGRPADAIPLHRRALEAGDGDAAGWAWLAEALDAAGDPESAQDAASTALARAAPDALPEGGESLSIAHEIIARGNLQRGQAATALAGFEKALALRRGLAQADPDRLSLLLRETGESRLRSGDPAGAVLTLRESIALLPATAGTQPALAQARMALGDALAASGQPGALEVWQDALAKWTASVTTTSAPPARLLASIGEALTEAGRTGEARAILDQALARAGDDPALRIRVHRALSRTAAAAKDPVDSLRHAQLALATAAGPPPATPAETAGLCGDLAALHLERGEIQRAIEYGERAVSERRKAGLTNDAATAATWILLGRAREAEKSHAAAAAAWSNAVHVLMQVDGANALSVALARTREGRAWIEAGQAGQAARSLEAARLVYRIRTSADPAARADTLLALGAAREMLGEHEKAKAALESALTVAAAGGEACDEIRGRTLLGLARIARTGGRLFESRRRVAECVPLLEKSGATEVSEALDLDRALQAALAPHGPQGTYAELPAFLAAEADRAARRADGTPR